MDVPEQDQTKMMNEIILEDILNELSLTQWNTQVGPDRDDERL